MGINPILQNSNSFIDDWIVRGACRIALSDFELREINFPAYYLLA